jgi:hypothetical protein
VFSVLSYLPKFEESDTQGKRLTFELLKEAVQTSPESLRRIINNVLNLPTERRDELAGLLERVSLEAMIGAFKVVTGRLDFLKGLELLVFDPISQEQLAERTQLHRILAGNTWIFGEEFNLTVDDKGLTKVLEAHLHLLGRDAKGATPVRREDGSVGIVDLMLSRSLPQQKNEREHLVVELKAPRVVLDASHTEQIESYAYAVANDQQFRDTKTTWTFVLVGNEYNDAVRRKINQHNRPSGMLFEPEAQDDLRYKIWVRTWAQIIEDCRWRMKFFQDQFNYIADDDSAIAYLREKHEKLLPKIFTAPAHEQDEPDIIIPAPTEDTARPAPEPPSS